MFTEKDPNIAKLFSFCIFPFPSSHSNLLFSFLFQCVTDILRANSIWTEIKILVLIEEILMMGCQRILGSMWNNEKFPWILDLTSHGPLLTLSTYKVNPSKRSKIWKFQNQIHIPYKDKKIVGSQEFHKCYRVGCISTIT